MEIGTIYNLTADILLLDVDPDDYRDDFGLKLALLSNQWQGVVRRAQQRRGIIDALVCQWQRYTELSDKLRHWLREAALEPEEEPRSPQRRGRVTALQQARGVLDHIQVRYKDRSIPPSRARHFSHPPFNAAFSGLWIGSASQTNIHASATCIYALILSRLLFGNTPERNSSCSQDVEHSLFAAP